MPNRNKNKDESKNERDQDQPLKHEQPIRTIIMIWQIKNMNLQCYNPLMLKDDNDYQYNDDTKTRRKTTSGEGREK